MVVRVPLIALRRLPARGLIPGDAFEVSESAARVYERAGMARRLEEEAPRGLAEYETRVMEPAPPSRRRKKARR